MGTHGDSTCVAQWLTSCVATVGTHVYHLRLLELHGRTGAGVFMLPVLLAALFEGGGSLLPAGLIICAISG